MRSHSQEKTRSPFAQRLAEAAPKKRSHRIIMVAAASLAITGLVAGGGFAVQSAVAAQDRTVASNALAESNELEQKQLNVDKAIKKAETHNAASVVLEKASNVIAASANKADATTLTASVTSLAGFKTMPIDKVTSLTAQTKAQTATLTTATAAATAKATAAAAAAAEADRVAAAAAADAAAQAESDKAAAAAAAEAEAEAEPDAPAAPVGGASDPVGARGIAKGMAAERYGWGESEFSCLDQLWEKESGWDHTAVNPSSGATGIPQALPGSKMATAGEDWATNPATQIAWGLEYISASSYGSPCAAFAHSEANNWY